MSKKKIIFRDDELEFIHFLLTEFTDYALKDGKAVYSTIRIDPFSLSDAQLISKLEEKIYNFLYET